ncbi:MAG: DUF350 domain-containing protein [Firmicutes bacterium]|nr:DUF350 domain-containing protein [Bacillota bacterium]
MFSLHALGTIALWWIVILAFLAVTTILFNLLTHYDDIGEIRKGNLAVALASSGKLIGNGLVLLFAMMNNDSLTQTILWGGIGFVLLVITYFLFDLVTPRFRINEELQKGNLAVGALIFVLMLLVGGIIGAATWA